MRDVRIQKLKELQAQHGIVYQGQFDRSNMLKDVATAKDDDALQLAGRIVLFRQMGKMAFMTLQDESGRAQIAFKADDLGKENFTEAMNTFDLGDFIGVNGTKFVTQKGEPTLLVKEWQLLSKALRQPPEKWHGVADQETAWRQRYLDLMSNRDTLERFKFRSDFIRKLREFYWQHDFTEVETPVLTNAASGTLATPFKTHHEAYDIDVYLRIAPETFLKECLVGGFDRVFECGRIFRNEGVDPSHLQDFTMCEHYASYWNYEDNMRFTEQMLQSLTSELLGRTAVQIPDRDGNLISVDFKGPWPVVSIADLIQQDSGIDIHSLQTVEELREAVTKNKIELKVDINTLGRGGLIDQLYKKVSRPKLIEPVFVTKHPLDISPLARTNDENPAITDRFQLVVGTWEVVNAYSELIDPIDQAQRFDDQAKAQAAGDAEAHGKDDEYVKALEYGCPPCSGWGMGIDRITALLAQQNNIREMVLFPLMKPEGAESQEPRAQNLANSQKQKANSSQNDESIKALPNDHGHHQLPNDHGHHLLEHADYGHLLPAAHSLLEKHVDQTKAHLLATGATMAALAKKFGGNEATWRVAGMLHDLDWDSLDKDADRHCGEELQAMLSEIDAPNELLGDIRAHYAHMYGADYPLDTMLRKALYCCDELTGFIIAVALVRPSKKLEDVQVKSVTKKLKDKGFAAQVDREQIYACKELLGLEINEMVELTLEAMKPIAEELGL